jgi:DNA repair protein RadD
MRLRPYQQAAVDAVYRHLRDHDTNPVVVIPTGGGKTPVMATICRDAVETWQGRVLILAHVKELLQQSVDKLKQVCPDLKVGVYSAGLKRRDTEHAVIVAGIQSVYQRAEELGAFDLILADECFVEGTLVSTPSGDVPIEQVLLTAVESGGGAAAGTTP